MSCCLTVYELFDLNTNKISSHGFHSEIFTFVQKEKKLSNGFLQGITRFLFMYIDVWCHIRPFYVIFLKNRSQSFGV